MRKFLFFFLFVSCLYNAQGQDSDSMRYYQGEMIKIQRAYMDSLRADEQYNAFLQNYYRIRNAKDRYGAFMLYAQISSADFAKINADNSYNDFGPMSAPMISIGYGFSSKKGRRIFDFHGLSIGIDRKTKKNKETIRSNFSTFFQFEWGYDLIKSRAINFYPYAGFGFRTSSLEYEAEGQANPDFVNITDIIKDNLSNQSSTTEVSYQAGIAFEVALSHPSASGGVMVFVKVGTNRPFKEKSYSFKDISYNPRFHYGEWSITTGLKFFGR